MVNAISSIVAFVHGSALAASDLPLTAEMLQPPIPFYDLNLLSRVYYDPDIFICRKLQVQSLVGSFGCDDGYLCISNCYDACYNGTSCLHVSNVCRCTVNSLLPDDTFSDDSALSVNPSSTRAPNEGARVYISNNFLSKTANFLQVVGDDTLQSDGPPSCTIIMTICRNYSTLASHSNVMIGLELSYINEAESELADCSLLRNQVFLSASASSTNHSPRYSCRRLGTKKVNIIYHKYFLEANSIDQVTFSL